MSNEASRAVGRVAEVRGPLVDVRFDGGGPALVDTLPFDALTVPDPLTGQDGATLTVVQKRSDGIARCLNVTPERAVRLGAAAFAAGVWRKDPGDEALAAAVGAVRGTRSSSERVLETGIKAIDFLCPLCPGGVVGVFGGTGVGATVLVGELRHRLAASGEELLLALTARRADFDATRASRSAEAENLGAFDDGAIQTLFLLTENATDPLFAAETAVPTFDTALYLSPLLAARGLYPPVDPLYSRSRLLDSRYVGPEHADTYRRYLDAWARTASLMADPIYLELMALRASRRALVRFGEWEVERLTRLAPADAQLVRRVRKVEKFLTQPYYVAEPYTGMPGRTVPRTATVAAVRAILDGAYDHLPAQAFTFIGDIAEHRTA